MFVGFGKKQSTARYRNLLCRQTLASGNARFKEASNATRSLNDRGMERNTARKARSGDKKVLERSHVGCDGGLRERIGALETQLNEHRVSSERGRCS